MATMPMSETYIQPSEPTRSHPWRVIIQIPCLNEEETLPAVLNDIPLDLPNVHFETLVIDDGSTDRTVEVARELGVNYIVRHRGRKGLPAAFQSGMDAALAIELKRECLTFDVFDAIDDGRCRWRSVTARADCCCRLWWLRRRQGVCGGGRRSCWR